MDSARPSRVPSPWAVNSAKAFCRAVWTSMTLQPTTVGSKGGELSLFSMFAFRIFEFTTWFLVVYFSPGGV